MKKYDKILHIWLNVSSFFRCIWYLKVSSHQVVEIWSFWPKASYLLMTITLRVFLGLFQDWKLENLWPWGMRPFRQKFLPLLDHRNFWTFKIFSNFFSKKSIFRDFDDRFFQWRGCGWSEISFWRDPHRLGVKPHGRPKSRTGPPRGVTDPFSSLRWRKSRFWWKMRFFGQKTSKNEIFAIWVMKMGL